MSSSEQVEPQPIPLEGALTDPATLPRLYSFLSRGEWSGMVLVRAGDIERRVYFADGRQIWEVDADGTNLATVYEHRAGACAPGDGR